MAADETHGKLVGEMTASGQRSVDLPVLPSDNLLVFEQESVRHNSKWICLISKVLSGLHENQ